ncbi:MAG: hypothetical protein LBC20_14125, partial [Planctomycetaceae bacterium]|nr:hypothetical protein [Planctomycetaceae bacterium]
MQQFIAILKKECRQHRSLAASILLLGFVIQVVAIIATTIPMPFISFIALTPLITILYAGTAAAVSFSVEHEEKTFGFLRNLPVSPLAILLGKVMWVILGTIIVFTGSLFLAFFLWNVREFFEMLNFVPESVLTESPPIGQILLIFGTCFIEVIIWGFFWSTLCRHQIFAVIAAFASPIIVFFLAHYLCYNLQNINIFDMEVLDIISVRLKIIAVVGIAAVYSMWRWCKGTVRQNILPNIFPKQENAFYYPPIPTTPFMALLYQSVRQSLLVLLVGIVVTVVVCFTVPYTVFSNDGMPIYTWFGFFFFMLVSGGCTFGADQRNQSFRFLSRCGISAAKIWWSRILPFVFVFLPILITVIVMEFMFFLRVKNENEILNFNDFIIVISITITLWMIPFSVGTFLSIYCRSIIVSVVLTGALSFLFILWMSFGLVYFQFNPLWTTLPLMVMLLVASRFRVTDWLRERQSWNSLLKPLIPFFITVIIIISAIPFVRVYSVPYISLDEIEALLDKTN